MLNKQNVYRALEMIECDVDDQRIVLNAVAVIRCELRKEPPEIEAEWFDRGALKGRDAERRRCIEICEDPRWMDGMEIAAKLRDS